MYYPVVPLGIINSDSGIGTGFSSKKPSYNPMDVVTNLKRMINDQEPIDMIPWYNGFKGTIERNEKNDNQYIIKGKYTVNGSKVHIQDIPIVNGWIEPYEIKMDKKISLSKDDNNKIEDIKKNPGNNIINMVITFKGQELQKMFKDGSLDKYLLMTQNMSVTNLHFFNADGKLTKYDSINDILREFVKFRLAMYEKRKAYYILKLQNDLDISKYKVKFIKDYQAKNIIIDGRKVAELIKQLEDKGYPKFSHDHRVPESERSYTYLTSMHMISLTIDKIKELEDNMEICQALYDEYLNTPVKKIWLKEIDEFVVAYKKWCVEWEEENELADKADAKAKDGGKGRAKAKKDADDNDEDDEDEDTPKKKPAAKSVPKSKPTITVSSTNKGKNVRAIVRKNVRPGTK